MIGNMAPGPVHCANSWPDWLQGLQRWIHGQNPCLPVFQVTKVFAFSLDFFICISIFSLRSNSLFVFFTLFLPY